MYIAINKETANIINDDSRKIDHQLQPNDIFPTFEPDTMRLLYADLPPAKIFPHYDNLLGHFNVDQNGRLTEKSLTEKAAAGSIGFDLKLLQKQAREDTTLTYATHKMRTIELGLRLKLFNTVFVCQTAFEILDDEFENEVAQKYRPGFEMKLIKDYIAWIAEEKPANDKREEKYLKMNTTVNEIKEKYKPARTELKQLIVLLKEQEATAQAEEEITGGVANATITE